MILFAFEAYQAMAMALTKTSNSAAGRFRMARFENGEIYIQVETAVRTETCIVLGSIAPPDEQLLSTLLLAHTLKKEGAGRVTGLFPYLGYARHDKDKPGESLAAAWTGAIGAASGLDGVITIDVHSERAKQLFRIPVVSLSPAAVFAEALKRFGLPGSTIVAPDEGAIGRCEAVQSGAGIPSGRVPYFKKQRTATGVTHVGPIGEVGRQAVIVDDILDTGGTLLSACEKLVEAGAEEINVMVTHGLFTGERWKQLWGLGVKRIFCTDSVPLPIGACGDDIVRLSIVPLLAKELCSAAKT